MHLLVLFKSLKTQGLGNEHLRVILASLDKGHIWGAKIQVISLSWFKVPLIIKWPVSQEDFNSVGFPTWEGPCCYQSEANVQRLHFKHISFKIMWWVSLHYLEMLCWHYVSGHSNPRSFCISFSNLAGSGLRSGTLPVGSRQIDSSIS